MITLEMMPPLMFGGLILAMLIGFLVAFTLAALGLAFGFLSIHLGFFDLNFLQAIPGRIFGSVLSNELLLAIPFFTFMGSVLDRCCLDEDMLDSRCQLVGDMYLGAWGPSVLQIALFAGYTFLLGIFKPSHVPAVPKDARTLTGWPLWRKCLMGIIPSAVLIFVVLGTMMLGLATPTEAGAMGAIGAIVLAAIHHKER